MSPPDTGFGTHFSMESLVNNIEWAPITAVRGYGMLIEGRRVGLYNQTEIIINAKKTHWGVAYLLIMEAEWRTVERQMRVHEPPHDLTYMSAIPPELATISRAFIRERRQMYPDETPFYVGTSTKWSPEVASFTDLQTQILDLHRWIDKCCLGS